MPPTFTFNFPLPSQKEDWDECDGCGDECAAEELADHQDLRLCGDCLEWWPQARTPLRHVPLTRS